MHSEGRREEAAVDKRSGHPAAAGVAAALGVVMGAAIYAALGTLRTLVSPGLEVESPLGWLVAQVWDRFADRAFWCSQQAMRAARESADVVLYVVNATEEPEAAGYIEPELQVLDWLGKPALVLLNQVGTRLDAVRT